MLNYIKFAFSQVFGFLFSIFKLNKFKKYPEAQARSEASDFLYKHSVNSLKKININLNVKGEENIPDEPVLFVANHSSMLDGFIVLGSIKKSLGFIIADEPVWRNIPIVRKWMELVKCELIDRKNNRNGIKSINRAANSIKDGQNMVVFPEGDLTWVKDENAYVSDFRPGALKIAYKAKCPIVPIAIKNSLGTYEGYQPVGKIHSRDVEIEIFPSIKDHLENPKLKTIELADKIKNIMSDSIKAFRCSATQQ